MDEELTKLRNEVAILQSKLKREQLANKELAMRLLQNRDTSSNSSVIVSPTSSTLTVSTKPPQYEISPLTSVAESLLSSSPSGTANPNPSDTNLVSPQYESTVSLVRSRRRSSISSTNSLSLIPNNNNLPIYLSSLASIRRILALILTDRMHPQEAIRSEATLYGLNDEVKQLLLSIGIEDQSIVDMQSNHTISHISSSPSSISPTKHISHDTLIPYALPSFSHTVPLSDLFLVIGPPTSIIIETLQSHWKILNSGKAGKYGPPILGDILNENVETEVLYRYPPDIIDMHNSTTIPPNSNINHHIPLPSPNIPDFAYPTGANIRAINLYQTATACGFSETLAKQGEEWPTELQDALFGKHGLRRGPRTHMFVLNGSDAEDREVSSTVVGTSLYAAAGRTVPSRTRYCLCIAFTEPISHNLLLNNKTIKRYNSQARMDGSTSHRRNSVSSVTSTGSNGLRRESKIDNHKNNPSLNTTDASILLVPRVMCLISRFPFFSLHFEILRYAAILWRASMLQKLKQAHELGYITFAPPVTQINSRRGSMNRIPSSSTTTTNKPPIVPSDNVVRSASITTKGSHERNSEVASNVLSPDKKTNNKHSSQSSTPQNRKTSVTNVESLPSTSILLETANVTTVNASINSTPTSSNTNTNTSSTSSLWSGFKQLTSRFEKSSSTMAGPPPVLSSTTETKINNPVNLNDSTSTIVSNVSTKDSVSENETHVVTPVAIAKAIIDSTSNENISPIVHSQSMQNFVSSNTEANNDNIDSPVTNIDHGPSSSNGSILSFMNLFHTDSSTSTTSSVVTTTTTVTNPITTPHTTSSSAATSTMSSIFPTFLSGSSTQSTAQPGEKQRRLSLDLGDDVIQVHDKPPHHRQSASTSVIRMFTDPLNTSNSHNENVHRTSRSSSINSGTTDDATDTDDDDSFSNHNEMDHKTSMIVTKGIENTNLEADPLLDVDHLAEITAVLGTNVVCPSVIDIIHRYFLVNVPPPGDTVRVLLPGTLTTAAAFLSPTLSRSSLLAAYTNEYNTNTSVNNHGLPWSADKPPYITFTRSTLKEWNFFNKYTLPSTLPNILDLQMLESLVLQTLHDAELNPLADIPLSRIHKMQQQQKTISQTNNPLKDDASSVPSIHSWSFGCDIDHPETVSNVLQWAVPVLFSLLPIDSILLLIGAALTEHKIIFVGGNLSQESVSACVLALPSLLRPLSWIGPFLPMLPSNLTDILAAPIPILVGVATLPDNFEQDESTVIVLLDRETVRIPTVRHRKLHSNSKPKDGSSTTEESLSTPSKFHMTTYSSNLFARESLLNWNSTNTPDKSVSVENSTNTPLPKTLLNNGTSTSTVNSNPSPDNYTSPSQDILIPRFLDIQLPGNSILFHELEPISQIIRNTDKESVSTPRVIPNGDSKEIKLNNNQNDTNNNQETTNINKNATSPLLPSSNSSSSLLSKPVIIPHLYPRPCYKPTVSQTEAVEKIVSIINQHIRLLLSRAFAAGLYEDRIKDYLSKQNGNGFKLPLRYLPVTNTCKVQLIGKVPEVEEPFWACLLSSQMFAVYRDTISLRLSLKVGEEESLCATNYNATSSRRNSLSMNLDDRLTTATSSSVGTLQNKLSEEVVPIKESIIPPPPIPSVSNVSTNDGQIPTNDMNSSKPILAASRSAPRLARRGKPISLRHIMLGPTGVTDALSNTPPNNNNKTNIISPSDTVTSYTSEN